MWTLNMTIVVCFFLRDAGRIRILFAHLQPDLKLKLHRSIFRAAFQSLHKSLRYSRMAASTIFIYFVAFALTFNWFSILHFSPIPNRYVWINVFAFLWHERVDYLLQFSFLFMRLRILSKASRSVVSWFQNKNMSLFAVRLQSLIALWFLIACKKHKIRNNFVWKHIPK